jgi:hypothetical protein
MMSAVFAISSALPPPISVDVVCGGGLPALLKPSDGSASDCATVWRSVRTDIAEAQGGTQDTLAPYTNVTFSPLGYLDATSGVAYCRDGSLECLLYSLVLCAQAMGTSPASSDADVPSWMSLPAALFSNLPELEFSDNIYLDFIYEHTQETGYDWGYLTSCARSPATLRSLAAAFARSKELGLDPAPDGDANATVYVAGIHISDWNIPGTIAAAVCAAWPVNITPPMACSSGARTGASSKANPSLLTTQSLLSIHRPESVDTSTVNVELYCGGSLDAVSAYCAPFISDLYRSVIPTLGSAVNFTLIPSGVVRSVINSSGGVVQMPICTGGWAECELHGIFFCAQLFEPSQDWSELAGCLQYIGLLVLKVAAAVIFTMEWVNNLLL